MIVDISINKTHYSLTGDIDSILSNRRALISLRRLKFKHQKCEITIPYEIKSKIHTLQAIQAFLVRFDIESNLTLETKEELFSYNKEQELFHLFSEKARNIRNDEFSNNLDLVVNFREFKEILEKKMQRTLYPLQLLSAFHMAFAQNSCNFAVPGAGKTSIVYGAYSYLNNLPKENPKYVNKLLIIGPLSSFAPWEKEYKECFGTNIESQRLSGDKYFSREQKEQYLYSAKPKELTLISHAGIPLLENEIVDFLKTNKVMVVVDEAHRIKNAEGVWGISVVEIAKEACSRIVLTGTPVPNGYEDLYNLYRFIYPFKYQDILKIHFDQLKELTKNAVSFEDERVKAFTKDISPYFIRINKEDLDLKPPNNYIINIKMDELQKDIYSFIENKYIKSFKENSEGTIKDVLNRAKLIRLRQAATNPSLLLRPLIESMECSDEGADPNYKFAKAYNESIDDVSIFRKIVNYKKLFVPPKFLEIKELIKNKITPQKGKVIIWTIFIQNAEQLLEYLHKNGITSKLLIGRIPQEEREVVIDKFNNPNNLDFQVVIANPFSVSESISLHKGCHNAIYLERDYNAANFLQSKDRIHRVGLPANVETNYYYFISKHSIDSVINKKLDEKVKRMEKIIDQDIPLFQRLNDLSETDIIMALLKDYAQRS